MPRCPDMVILVLTESRQNRLHYTPCTCAPGNKYMHTGFFMSACKHGDMYMYMYNYNSDYEWLIMIEHIHMHARIPGG